MANFELWYLLNKQSLEQASLKHALQRAWNKAHTEGYLNGYEEGAAACEDLVEGTESMFANKDDQEKLREFFKKGGEPQSFEGLLQSLEIDTSDWSVAEYMFCQHLFYSAKVGLVHPAIEEPSKKAENFANKDDRERVRDFAKDDHFASSFLNLLESSGIGVESWNNDQYTFCRNIFYAARSGMVQEALEEPSKKDENSAHQLNSEKFRQFILSDKPAKIVFHKMLEEVGIDTTDWSEERYALSKHIFYAARVGLNFPVLPRKETPEKEGTFAQASDADKLQKFRENEGQIKAFFSGFLYSLEIDSENWSAEQYAFCQKLFYAARVGYVAIPVGT